MRVLHMQPGRVICSNFRAAQLSVPMERLQQRGRQQANNSKLLARYPENQGFLRTGDPKTFNSQNWNDKESARVGFRRFQDLSRSFLSSDKMRTVPISSSDSSRLLLARIQPLHHPHLPVSWQKIAGGSRKSGGLVLIALSEAHAAERDSCNFAEQRTGHPIRINRGPLTKGMLRGESDTRIISKSTARHLLGGTISPPLPRTSADRFFAFGHELISSSKPATNKPNCLDPGNQIFSTILVIHSHLGCICSMTDMIPHEDAIQIAAMQTPMLGCPGGRCAIVLLLEK
jgi:hypothetical protein